MWECFQPEIILPVQSPSAWTPPVETAQSVYTSKNEKESAPDVETSSLRYAWHAGMTQTWKLKYTAAGRCGEERKA